MVLLSHYYPGSERYVVLAQGNHAVDVTLYDQVAVNTSDEIEGHEVQIGPLSIVRNATYFIAMLPVGCGRHHDLHVLHRFYDGC